MLLFIPTLLQLPITGQYSTSDDQQPKGDKTTGIPDQEEYG